MYVYARVYIYIHVRICKYIYIYIHLNLTRIKSTKPCGRHPLWKMSNYALPSTQHPLIICDLTHLFQVTSVGVEPHSHTLQVWVGVHLHNITQNIAYTIWAPRIHKRLHPRYMRAWQLVFSSTWPCSGGNNVSPEGGLSLINVINSTRYSSLVLVYPCGFWHASWRVTNNHS